MYVSACDRGTSEGNLRPLGLSSHKKNEDMLTLEKIHAVVRHALTFNKTRWKPLHRIDAISYQKLLRVSCLSCAYHEILSIQYCIWTTNLTDVYFRRRRRQVISFLTPYYNYGSATVGLAICNPQQGHRIRRNSPKGRTCVFIHTSKRKTGELCAVLKVMTYSA